ncbi:MAG TPA: rhodanese-like domain-containing protein [Chthoniobacteraceae bacterium]|nr:rhodanese-like domain-containing protein [Chthoniobacteraceae bacterium]
MIARTFRQLIVLLALAVAPALVSGVVQLKWQQLPPAAAGEITIEEARKLGDQVLWVDARPRAKFEREHIPGAVLLNEDDWVRLVGPFLEAWAPEKTIVVYCDGGSCDASHHVARRIKEELQIENTVWVLQGGWDAWLRHK